MVNEIMRTLARVLLVVEAAALAFLMASWIRDRRAEDGIRS